MARRYLKRDFFMREHNESSSIGLYEGSDWGRLRYLSFSSRRSSSSIISSSEKVGLFVGMKGCQVWKFDGEASGDEDDDSEYDELHDENDDSDNRIYFSENIAMMETQLLQGTHQCYLSLFLFLGLFLTSSSQGFKQKG